MMGEFLKNLRNEVDYYLRSKFNFQTDISIDRPVPLTHQKLQAEIKEFFNLWPQDQWQSLLPKGPLNVLDVGARDFFMAPVLNDLFQSINREAIINGIEVDSHRRMTNFKTRADWGRYYCQKLNNTHFYSMDFLDWSEMTQVIFHLNPFVTLPPLMHWGLPKKYFKPQEIFAHTSRLLAGGGVLFLGTPSDVEMNIAIELCQNHGLKQVSDVRGWQPRKDTIQKRPRHGCFFTALGLSLSQTKS